MEKRTLIFFLLLIGVLGCEESREPTWSERLKARMALDSAGQSDSQVVGDTVVQAYVRGNAPTPFLRLGDGEVLNPLGKRMLIALNDSVKLTLVPIEHVYEGQVVFIRSYQLCVEVKQKITSFLVINGAWIDNDESGYEKEIRFLKAPYAFLRDLDNDGELELILKDRQHNGNMYNAGVEHIFRLHGGRISYLGKHEYVGISPFDEKFILREWDPGTWMVQCFVADDKEGKNRRKIGSYLLRLGDEGLEAIKPQIVDEEYGSVLVETEV